MRKPGQAEPPPIPPEARGRRGPPPVPDVAKRRPDELPLEIEVESPEFETPTVRIVETMTRASHEHQGRNEDAALGDTVRLRNDATRPLMLKTGDSAGDLKLIKDAVSRESSAAPGLKRRNVFGVLDGVSGKKGFNKDMGYEGTGAVASRLASAAIAESLSAGPEFVTVEQAKEEMKAALEAGNAAVQDYKRRAAEQGRGPEMKEVATTASLVKLVENADGSTDAVIGSVGDSRVYKFDVASKKLIQLTRDENMFSFMARQGVLDQAEFETISKSEDLSTLPTAIAEKVRAYMVLASRPRRELTPEQAVLNARDGVFNALSGDGVIEIGEGRNVFSTKLQKGDRLLLSSDGLHDNLTDREIEEHFAGGGTLESLIVKAYERSKEKKPDDVTAQLIEIGGGAPRPEIAKLERRAAEEERRRTGLAETYRTLEIYGNPLESPAASPAPAKKKSGVSGVFKKMFGIGRKDEQDDSRKAA